MLLRHGTGYSHDNQVPNRSTADNSMTDRLTLTRAFDVLP